MNFLRSIWGFLRYFGTVFCWTARRWCALATPLGITATASTLVYVGIGAYYHQLSITRWPSLVPVVGKPVSEVWIGVFYLFLPAVTLGLLVFLLILAVSPSQLYREQQAEIERLRERFRSPLTVTTTRVDEHNGQCSMFRVVVTNSGESTQKNVCVRIVEFAAKTRKATKDVAKYV